jgi:2'-5' RNA ligase
MNSPTKTKTKTTTNLFIAIPIPKSARTQMKKSLKSYSKFVADTLPEKNWHLTFLSLGEVKHYQRYLRRMAEDLPRMFLPTISFTHVGRGHDRDQLWAYAQRANVLDELHSTIRERLVKIRVPASKTLIKKKIEFIPHVKLANMLDITRGMGLADRRINVTFMIKQIVIYKSESDSDNTEFSAVGIINLLP